MCWADWTSDSGEIYLDSEPIHKMDERPDAAAPEQNRFLFQFFNLLPTLDGGGKCAPARAAANLSAQKIDILCAELLARRHGASGAHRLHQLPAARCSGGRFWRGRCS